MKGKLIVFASILCIASLMASGANADKPENPGNKGKTKTQLIVFTGALQGWAHVAGCCPNAGPYPEYTITLPEPLVDDSVSPETVYPAGTYNGHLFMNSYGAGQVSEYIVQFHACCTDEDSDDLCEADLPEMKFEIIGGTKVGVGKKKDRVLTVTFKDEKWWRDWDRTTDMGPVSFEITRAESCTGTVGICPCETLYPSDICPTQP